VAERLSISLLPVVAAEGQDLVAVAVLVDFALGNSICPPGIAQ
jgi:hypothetical protein